MANPDKPSAERGAAPSQPSLVGTLIGRIGALLRNLGGTASLKDSLEAALDEAEKGGDIPHEEKLMLRNILEIGDLRVGDIMVPRADIIGVEEDTNLIELTRIFRDAQHSRLPIYRGTLDNPIGMVHLKDLIGLLLPGEPTPAKPFRLADYRRELIFVPPSMSVVDLLMKMRATRIHLALIIDEYGGTEGLVSLEDLVEQIVGDISDEHDTEAAPALVANKDGTFEADARVPVENLEKAMGIKLVEGDLAGDIDTLGGLVVSIVGRVPAKGESVTHKAGIAFDIVEADARKLKRLRVRRLPRPKSAESARVSGKKVKARASGG